MSLPFKYKIEFLLELLETETFLCNRHQIDISPQGGIKLPDISFLRKNVRGIKGAFLTKEGDVLETDVKVDEDVKYLSKSISYLIEEICNKKGNVQKLSIMGNDQFFIFFDNMYILGVVASDNINEPLLNIVANRMLKHAEIPKLEVLVFDSGYRVKKEDIIEGFRSVPDEKWKAIVLEYVDGKRSIDKIVEEAFLIIHQQNLKQYNGRDFTKEDIRGLLGDFLNTTVLKLKKG
jgi:hypothetical protein